MDCSICGRFFTNSLSLGVHISREHISWEHGEGICLPDVDFNFDPNFICGVTNVPEENSDKLDRK